MKKSSNMIRIVLLIAAAAAIYFFGDSLGLSNSNSSTTTQSSTQSSSTTQNDSLIMQDIEVYDLDGDLVYKGDVDLAPVLARIERGERDSHDNDGSVFGNYEGLLPKKPKGYYREYVVRTPGLRSVGPQRLILGENGEAYYTSDHYESFTRVR